MADLVEAVVYTVSSFVAMLFNMATGLAGVSVGSFLLACGILSVIIKILFSVVGTKPSFSHEPPADISHRIEG